MFRHRPEAQQRQEVKTSDEQDMAMRNTANSPPSVGSEPEVIARRRCSANLPAKANAG